MPAQQKTHVILRANGLDFSPQPFLGAKMNSNQQPPRTKLFAAPFVELAP